jgi:ethanolamine utilization protein EutA (predicted chaperonin)
MNYAFHVMAEGDILKVVAFIPQNNVQAEQVRLALAANMPPDHLEILPVISAIIDRFGAPLDRPTILVAYVDSQQTLSQLAAFKDLLSTVDILLVVPSDEKRILEIGHSLRPRVILYMDYVATQLIPILNRMQNRSEPAS